MIEPQASQQTPSSDKEFHFSQSAGENRPRNWAQGRRALIVEDETLVGWHLESVLQQLGLEVLEIVSTGEEAIAEAIGAKPDIVFMDINLSGPMDGVEAARQILERLTVPIVFVTAYADDEAALGRIRAIQENEIVVGKPATPIAIEAALRRIESY